MRCCSAPSPRPACCPIAADTFRAAIRAEGKAVDANLRGFEAGHGVWYGVRPYGSTGNRGE